MVDSDPLAVIAQVQPRISDALAVETIKARYGLDVSVSSLVSERDQNFVLRTSEGPEYVFKIANAAEDPAVTDFQVKALLHIENIVTELGIPVVAPTILRTLDGADQFVLEAPDGHYVSRVVSFIAGVPLAERIASPALARDMGTFLAYLGIALRDYSHPGSGHSLLWDLEEALRLRELVQFVRDRESAAAVTSALDDFEQFALPSLAGFRRQVIHNDFNADNVVIESADPDKVAGVIDFGDMLAGPLIADVAIGASYLRSVSGDPLLLMAEFLSAYHRVTALTVDEIDVLFELIQARLCGSVAIMEWRASMRGDDDPYLQKLTDNDASASRALQRLREIPRESARRVFREVCASAGTVRRG
jgi:Ser/Thr protein kinase RdoA (MazF antagonist)